MKVIIRKAREIIDVTSKVFLRTINPMITRIIIPIERISSGNTKLTLFKMDSSLVSRSVSKALMILDETNGR